MLLSSCINFRHDITDNKKAWYPYEIGKEYLLREDVFLMKVDSGMEPERLALVPVSDSHRGSGFYSSPKSVEEYEENPIKASRRYFPDGDYYEIDVVGIVRAGTIFSPSRIMQNAGLDLWFGNHTFNTKYGRIKSGPFTGKEVDILDISWFNKVKDLPNRYVEITN